MGLATAHKLASYKEITANQKAKTWKHLDNFFAIIRPISYRTSFKAKLKKKSVVPLSWTSAEFTLISRPKQNTTLTCLKRATS